MGSIKGFIFIFEETEFISSRGVVVLVCSSATAARRGHWLLHQRVTSEMAMTDALALFGRTRTSQETTIYHLPQPLSCFAAEFQVDIKLRLKAMLLHSCRRLLKQQ
jgi:hypothetical protein